MAYTIVPCSFLEELIKNCCRLYSPILISMCNSETSTEHLALKISILLPTTTLLARKLPLLSRASRISSPPTACKCWQSCHFFHLVLKYFAKQQQAEGPPHGQLAFPVTCFLSSASAGKEREVGPHVPVVIQRPLVCSGPTSCFCKLSTAPHSRTDFPAFNIILPNGYQLHMISKTTACSKLAVGENIQISYMYMFKTIKQYLSNFFRKILHFSTELGF